MEEVINWIAQAQHNPTWNVYLCWLLIVVHIIQYFTLTVEDLEEEEKELWEEDKVIVNGKFTHKYKIRGIVQAPFIALGHDMIVVFINQGELIINIYNKMFFGQFLSFTTISNLLT